MLKLHLKNNKALFKSHTKVPLGLSMENLFNQQDFNDSTARIELQSGRIRYSRKKWRYIYEVFTAS